jgi:hypothetical protein
MAGVVLIGFPNIEINYGMPKNYKINYDEQT